MKICSVQDCEGKAITRGWCKIHYNRWYLRGGDPAVKMKSGRKPGTVGGDNNPRWRGGISQHPLKDIYHEMIARCTRSTHPRYADYGGRGIRVHPEWVEDFWAFIRDVGERPEGKTEAGRAYWQLDRIDNDGNYEPGNVRWATPSQQSKNRRGFGDFESRRDPDTGRFT